MAQNKTESELGAAFAVSGMSSMSDEKEFYQPEVPKDLGPATRYVPYSPGRNPNAQVSDLPEVGPDPDVISQKIAVSPQQYQHVNTDKYSVEPVDSEKAGAAPEVSSGMTRKKLLPWYRQRLNICIIITLIVVIIVAVVLGAVVGTILPKHDKR